MYEQQSLFYKRIDEPLANRMRPKTLDDVCGQRHLIGKGKILRNMIDQDIVPSMIFWGPPGIGKTTLARIIANKTKADFINFSAVTSGIKEIKDVMKQAEEKRLMGLKTIVFVDEIHRFNKSQQDAFLPYVEKGSIILIGATTENPSFEINSALLSRCKVFVLNQLGEEDLYQIIKKVLEAPDGLGDRNVVMPDELIRMIAAFASGDARVAINTIEMVVLNGEISEDKVIVTKQTVEQCTGKKFLLYDKNAEEHYNIISALHKSMRTSNVDAALYWTARMLEAGENPLYIARRLIRFASEDVGMADSHALEVCIAAYQACHFLGMPECNVNLAHAVIYLSLAPKSRKTNDAYYDAAKDAKESISEPVPLNIRNAPTKLMEELGYGEGYHYDENSMYNISAMQCMPNSLEGRKYYYPSEFGNEAGYKKILEQLKKVIPNIDGRNDES